PAQCLQAVEKCCQTRLSIRTVRGHTHEHADAAHALALLRARRERPRSRHAAEQRGELTALHLRGHSITSSAMASSPGGKLRLNAPAVLRLITNSNLIDCMTGRSADFSPLRIRPVYTPAWRYASLRLVP